MRHKFSTRDIELWWLSECMTMRFTTKVMKSHTRRARVLPKLRATFSAGRMKVEVRAVTSLYEYRQRLSNDGIIIKAGCCSK